VSGIKCGDDRADPIRLCDIPPDQSRFRDSVRRCDAGGERHAARAVANQYRSDGSLYRLSPPRTPRVLRALPPTRLQHAARKHSRYGHRDATAILIAYRHGLRASELCELTWNMIELDSGRIHVRRAKNGVDSTHPLTGKEIRALRQLRREKLQSRFIFNTERGGPVTRAWFLKMIRRQFNTLLVKGIPELCGNGPDDLCSIGVAGIGDLNRWLIAHGVPIREGRTELLPTSKQ
jgi:integrase